MGNNDESIYLPLVDFSTSDMDLCFLQLLILEYFMPVVNCDLLISLLILGGSTQYFYLGTDKEVLLFYNLLECPFLVVSDDEYDVELWR